MRKLTVFAASALCITTLLTGCGALPNQTAANEPSSEVPLPIGQHLTVDDSGFALQRYEQNDALAANGMYYATWTDGSVSDYVNDKGDTVDLYEAQLYLLLEESKTAEQAAENKASWYEIAKEHYEIESEEEVTIGNESYQLVRYQVNHEVSPYDHGISAFSTHGDAALCAELTCLDSYDGDLDAMMKDFLEHCTWKD